ncbi:class I SAM-dependent methyltransferase [Actinopolymorpha sp. NPDC004070]|uniref:class I SAM-dependent methyltransferase n=1 Tax=Actinopolymorpha sp. NPDC004070 TaxID=3154548 RepID=UPI0033BA57EC
MEESVRRSLGRSFGSTAADYERSRPDYPQAAAEWLLAGLDDSPRARAGWPATVVELAAGTGKFTRSLVAAGHDVIAVEPAQPMLDRLVRAVPEAVAVRGVAERIPLADSSADAVLVAQAFHWFDTEPSLAEIARVLRPGGMFGLVWNYRDESVPWVRQLSRLLGSDRQQTGHAEELIEKLEWSRLFTPPKRTIFRMWQRLDRQGLVRLVASRSYVSTMSPADREDLLFNVGQLFDVTARQPDGLLLPYTTICYRAGVRKW